MKYQFVAKSRNRKIGPMPVTMTERKSCPPDCPLVDAGCYADGFPLSLHWGRIADAGITIGQLADKIRALATGQLWRMNAAGDLPGAGGKLSRYGVDKIVTANADAGARGFTYTHYSTRHDINRAIIGDANARGFTINLSANTLADADRLSDLKIGPVVTILGRKARGSVYTPAGRRVVVCPAVTHDRVNCFNCGLCARTDGRAIIGFPAHGNRAKLAERIATAG